MDKLLLLLLTFQKSFFKLPTCYACDPTYCNAQNIQFYSGISLLSVLLQIGVLYRNSDKFYFK